jgi:hypothetical protein
MRAPLRLISGGGWKRFGNRYQNWTLLAAFLLIGSTGLYPASKAAGNPGFWREYITIAVCVAFYAGILWALGLMVNGVRRRSHSKDEVQTKRVDPLPQQVELSISSRSN